MAIAISNRQKIPGPRVGDWVYNPSTENYSRIVHDYGSDIQIGGSQDSSYFLYNSGWEEFSGTCLTVYPKTRLVDDNRTKAAFVWIFHEGSAGAGRRVDMEIQERVYRLID